MMPKNRVQYIILNRAPAICHTLFIAGAKSSRPVLSKSLFISAKIKSAAYNGINQRAVALSSYFTSFL